MKWSGLHVVAPCLLVCACGQDPARSVKVVERPPQTAEAPATPPAAAPAKAPAAPDVPVMAYIDRSSPPVSITVKPTPSPAQDPNWIPGVCQPPAGDSTSSNVFIAKGPCGFERREAASCEAAPDDLYIAFTRKSAAGATLVFYLNVENYRGPGVYDRGEMFLAAQSATTIYRWSNDNAQVTVGPDGGFVILPETRLEGEPMLVECTRLIGPATNYQYQCGGRSSDNRAMNEVAETVSGTLQCTRGR